MQALPLRPLAYQQRGFPLRRPKERRAAHPVWQVAGQQGEQRGGDAIHVRVTANVPGWGAISGCATPGHHSCVRPKQTDITEAGLPIEEEDIFGFHIAMNQPGVRQRLQGFENRQHHPDDFPA